MRGSILVWTVNTPSSWMHFSAVGRKLAQFGGFDGGRGFQRSFDGRGFEGGRDFFNRGFDGGRDFFNRGFDDRRGFGRNWWGMFLGLPHT